MINFILNMYKYQLSSDEEILALLKVKIPIIYICKDILKFKKKDEQKDTYEYHKNQWDNIVGSYFATRDSQYLRFSLISNRETYLVITDQNRSFYNLTGLSYQCVELLHETIKMYGKKSIDFDFDELYSILSNKIMEQMTIKRRFTKI